MNWNKIINEFKHQINYKKKIFSITTLIDIKSDIFQHT